MKCRVQKRRRRDIVGWNSNWTISSFVRLWSRKQGSGSIWCSSFGRDQLLQKRNSDGVAKRSSAGGSIRVSVSVVSVHRIRCCKSLASLNGVCWVCSDGCDRTLSLVCSSLSVLEAKSCLEMCALPVERSLPTTLGYVMKRGAVGPWLSWPPVPPRRTMITGRHQWSRLSRCCGVGAFQYLISKSMSFDSAQ